MTRREGGKITNKSDVRGLRMRGGGGDYKLQNHPIRGYCRILNRKLSLLHTMCLADSQLIPIRLPSYFYLLQGPNTNRFPPCPQVIHQQLAKVNMRS